MKYRLSKISLPLNVSLSLRVLLLFVFIFTILLSSVFFFIFSYTTNVTTTSVSIPFSNSETGAFMHISTILFSPRVLPSGEQGAALIFHGVLAHKEWMHNYGSSLASNGLFALCVDLKPWGCMQESTESQVLLQIANCSLKFLMNTTHLPMERISVIGHSLGMGVALMLAKEFPAIQATVLIGNEFSSDAQLGIPPSEYWPLNLTSPRNLLYAVSRNDEIISLSDSIEYFASAVNSSPEDVIPFKTYNANFSMGLARRLVVVDSGHIFELIDHTIIYETTNWLLSALKMGTSSQINFGVREFILSLNAFATALLFLYIFLLIVKHFFVQVNEEKNALSDKIVSLGSHILSISSWIIVLAFLPKLRQYQANPLDIILNLLELHLGTIIIVTLCFCLSIGVSLILYKKNIDKTISPPGLLVLAALGGIFLVVFYLFLLLGMISFWSHFIYVILLILLSLGAIGVNILSIRISDSKHTLIVQSLLLGAFLTWLSALWIPWIVPTL
ncbi:MAG: hypothetical protein ACFFC7_25345 [Candidatus Hermodarchaeota archaeon]